MTVSIWGLEVSEAEVASFFFVGGHIEDRLRMMSTIGSLEKITDVVDRREG